MSVHSLDIGDIIDSIHRLVKSDAFIKANSHLTSSDICNLLQSPPVWPHSPVFSPFATTHHGYSQIKIRGVKYLLHRVAYALIDQNFDPTRDVSHTLYLGDYTTSNFNPLYLIQEDNEVNQSRKLCFLFMEQRAWNYTVGLTTPQWGPCDLYRHTYSMMAMCRQIHRHKPCTFDVHYL
ncbi:hypothetical protein V1520DRAFT_350767 [Lipomyces starkeyi]|uniref:Uncharacterized protein n=1 Tax=Lipomyces starkeyi NRRL Y-11557 TaxID=675824 RepID=A0A1E3PU40_LIPST|nr:hypothetical protein LIPSTDRAFT_76735 [Lipomyces starkeyi NRRL Y-11557]